MLYPEEKQYLYWTTRHAYEGWGAIVDLGPWVGASSALLAAGLRDRGMSARVQSFDRFVWVRSYMEEKLPEDLPEGGDFLPVFERETAPFAPWIDAERMDLLEAEWNGGEIEILFVDAAKSWELLNAIHRAFGPHLRAGRSRVIHQDFRHFYTIWIPLAIDSRPDVWQQIEAVDDGDSVTFVPQRPLFGEGGLPDTYRQTDFSFSLADEIFRRRLERERTSENKVRLLLGWLRTALLYDQPERVADLRERLAKDPRNIENLTTAEMFSAWDHWHRGDVSRASAIASECLKRTPDDTQALCMSGLCARDRGDHAQAVTYFRRVTSHNPNDASVRICLADSCYQLGDFSAAGEELIAIFRNLSEDSPDQWVQFAFEQLERLWAADTTWPLSSLDDLQARFESSPHLHVFEAIVHYHRGHTEQATNELVRALELAPGHARAEQLLAKLRNGSWQ